MPRLDRLWWALPLLLILGWAGVCGYPTARSVPEKVSSSVFHKGRVFLTREEIAAASRIAPEMAGVRSLLHVPKRMHFGDSIWNEQGAGAGEIWVRVDLAKQLMSVFRGGDEIGTAVIVYGADSHLTPRGTFAILGKSEHYRSRSYDAPMPYSLWLTGDGVAIHASEVRRGSATHGCIGVPLDFAKRLFSLVKPGDRVVIVGN